MNLLPLSDPRWKAYRSGYNRVPIDITEWLNKLEGGKVDESHWNYLWDELHHQNDVGEASYAVVPYLAKYSNEHKRYDWHIFAFSVVVELARQDSSENPVIPDELVDSYFWGIQELARIAVENVDRWDDIQAPCMSACIALAKGHPIFARAYLEISTIEIASRFLKDEIGWEPSEK